MGTMETRNACIGAEGLESILEAIKNSDVAITINVNISGNISNIQEEKPAPVNEPIHEPEIPAGFFIVLGEPDLYYGHKHGALQISLDGNTVTTTWKNVKTMASQNEELITKEAVRKYPDETNRSMFLRFLTAYQEGRVKPLRAPVVEPEVIPVNKPVEEKPDMSANISSVDWSTVPAQVFGDMEYKECRSKIRLKQGNDICCTTWDCIVKLATLPFSKLHNKIAALFNSPNYRDMIHSLIDLYRTDVIRDPDYFARPMVMVDTRADYDGNKIWMEEAY
jgi:hypothetical protein